MDPQSCTKCNALPEDILMLACSHDLCLNCASDRLAFQLKKKKPANSIVCEFCYERTPLDAESISELEKLIPAKSSVRPNHQIGKRRTDYEKIYQEPPRNAPVERQKPVQRFNYEKTSKLGIDRGYEKQPQKVNYPTYDKQLSGISSKKQCQEHPEQQILYFCFDCKCECICPECVIHGKHKNHDVKTLRKSQPLIKTQVEGSLQKLQNNIEGLLIRKSQSEKQVRSLTEQSNVSKRQIQQAFQNLRSSIATQQKEILAKCDQVLTQNLQELERLSMGIVKRIEELKFCTSSMAQSIKKEDIVFLNYYSNKWKQINEQIKDNDVHVPLKTLPSNEAILSSILDANDHVIRIGSHRTPINHSNEHRTQ